MATYGSVNLKGNDGDDLLQEQVLPKNEDERLSNSTKSQFRELFKLSWPLLLTQLSMAAIPISSVIFCGHLDATALGAVSLANSVINVTCLAVGVGLATACDTLFSQSFGSAHKMRVGEYLQKSVLILGLACLPCWAVQVNTESLLRLSGQDEEVARLAGRYLLFYMPSVFFIFQFIVLEKYIQNQNIVLPNVFIGILSNVVNAGLHYLLVFTLDMRTDGSALAQVGANCTMFILTLQYIAWSGVYVDTWPGWSLGCLLHWGSFVRLALPGLLMVCLEWWCFEAGTLVSGVLGTVDLNAQSIIFYVELVCFQVPIAVSIAASIRVGQYLGAGRGQPARLVARVSFAVVGFWGVLVAVLLYTLRYQIPKVFSQDQTVIARAADILPILSSYAFFETFGTVSAGILRGCGRQMACAVLILLAYYVIALPVGLSLMLLTPLTVVGLWVGYAIGIFLESIGLGFLVYTTNWTLEAAQAQVRTGVRSDSFFDKGPRHSTFDQSGDDVGGRSNGDDDDDDTATHDCSSRDEVPFTQSDFVDETSALLRAGRRVSVDVTKSLGFAASPRSSLKRHYSSSALVSLLHGRRFAAPTPASQRHYAVATRARRFSAKHTPQIQCDALGHVTDDASDAVTCRLLVGRLAILAACVAVLVGGVLTRLYWRYPYRWKEECIPIGSAFDDDSLPLCNSTSLG